MSPSNDEVAPAVARDDVRYVSIDGGRFAMLVMADGRTPGVGVATAQAIIEQAIADRQVVKHGPWAGRDIYELSEGNNLGRFIPQPLTRPTTFSLPPDANLSDEDERYLSLNRRLAGTVGRRNTRGVAISNSQRVLIGGVGR